MERCTPICFSGPNYRKGNAAINATGSAAPLPAQEDAPALIKKIGKTTYKVRVHFSTTSTETMGDKIKRMLRNEI